jgi:hypothetical protein
MLHTLQTTPFKEATKEDIYQGAIRIRDCFQEMEAEPFFIGRNGTVEIETLYFWMIHRRGSEEKKEYPPRLVDQIQRNAGVFPATGSSIDSWAEAYAKSLGYVNGAAIGWYKPMWHVDTMIFKTFGPANYFATPLRSLEPYYVPSDFRWTQHLAGKRVAVVSSFAESIQRQVWGEKKAQIWKGAEKDILAAANVDWTFLRTGYAPTTALGRAEWPKEVKTWQDAVAYVVEKVVTSGAQVALIGCGALGMIIGAQLRIRGISAFVMGGAIQVLFGIRGNRWKSHDVISKFWNDAWVWPRLDEIPGGATMVEGGCYWGTGGP